MFATLPAAYSWFCFYTLKILTVCKQMGGSVIFSAGRYIFMLAIYFICLCDGCFIPSLAICWQSHTYGACLQSHLYVLNSCVCKRTALILVRVYFAGILAVFVY